MCPRVDIYKLFLPLTRQTGTQEVFVPQGKGTGRKQRTQRWHLMGYKANFTQNTVMFNVYVGTLFCVFLLSKKYEGQNTEPNCWFQAKLGQQRLFCPLIQSVRQKI